jgi:asparagine synthase (glutamine-hydrolysing)
MCGICGVASLEGPIDPAVGASVRAMADAIYHRGPDSDGFRDSETAVLGFRRLAIIDRTGGNQPIGNEDGTCWIVFNGEIYNHHELRAELIAEGHRFRTRADTETILHGWEQHGPAVVERLDGMFAFAIHDERTRTTFIARDRVGKKPLYYAVLGGILHFASELPALRHSPRWDGTLDLSALEGYLSLGYFLSPDSIVRAVRKLPPGHWLRLQNGRIEILR